MARKTKIVTIETGRDAGKRFEITEPSAFEAEMFIMKLTALSNEEGSFLDGSLNINSLTNKLSTKEGEALYNSLLQCVKIIPGSNSNIKRNIDREDVEDYLTLFKLRMEALNLITGFTLPDEH